MSGARYRAAKGVRQARNARNSRVSSGRGAPRGAAVNRPRLSVLEVSGSFLGKRRHAFLLIFGREGRVKDPTLKANPSAKVVSYARLTKFLR